MNPDTRICVVGGGIGGISAAWFLEKKGYRSVTLLEREDRLGGKCLTHSKGDHHLDLGGMMISPQYKHVRGWAKQFGMKLTPLARMDYQSHRSGRSVTLPPLGLKELKTIKRFHDLLGEMDDYLTTPGHLNTPPELAQPFSAWLRERGMEGMLDSFVTPFTVYGYGLASDLPAAYVLKFFDQATFRVLFAYSAWDAIITQHLGIRQRFIQRLEEGAGALVQRLGGTLRDARTGADIQQVTRGDDVRVRWVDRATGVEHTEIFDKIVFAHLLTRDGMSFVDLDEQEERLFDRVITRRYWSIACDVEGLPHRCVYLTYGEDGGLEIPPVGYPTLYFRLWEDDDLCVFFLDSDDPSTDPATILPTLEAGIEQLGGRLRAVREARPWTFFPRVDSQAIAEGFYDELEGRQGQRHSYYAGALMNFELMERVAGYSHHLVERFF